MESTCDHSKPKRRERHVRSLMSSTMLATKKTRSC